MLRTDKRQAVLDAALRLFAECTYEGAKMPMVAERAAIGVGTVYRYFPSKEALGNAVFQYAKNMMLAHLTVDGRTGSVREEFGVMWRGLARFAAEHPDALAFLEHQQHETFLDEESRALSARVDDMALDFVRRGQAAGQIRDADPSVLVPLAFGAFIGITKAARDAGTVLSDAAVSAAENAVWDLLHGTEGTREQ